MAEAGTRHDERVLMTILPYLVLNKISTCFLK